MSQFYVDDKPHSLLFCVIVERPNLIVLEFMANGALDKYLQVKSQKLNLLSCKSLFVLNLYFSGKGIRNAIFL